MSTFDMLVRAFFSDNGLSAGLAKANAGLTQLGKSGPGARAGLRAVEIGARQLAFSAAGLSGGVGQLARGLLMFGGGSALMLGATAGIGALALAYRHFTRDTRENAEAQKKLREELHRVADARRLARTPETEQIGTQQEQRESDFQRLNRLIAQRQRDIASSIPAAMFVHETESQALTRLLADDKELNALYAERRKLGQDIRSERESSVDAAKKEADEQRRLNEELRRAKLELIQIQAIDFQMFRAGLFGTNPLTRALVGPRSDVGFATFGAQGTPLGFGVPGTAATFANIRGNQPRFVPDPFPRPKPSNLMANLQSMQTMAMSLMLARGGGASGAISGLGGFMTGAAGIQGISKGLAGFLGPAGLVTSALGGIFGLFNNDEERRHKEMIQAMRDLRPIIEQARVTRIIVSPTGQFIAQTEHEIGRREDRDAVDRDGRSI